MQFVQRSDLCIYIIRHFCSRRHKRISTLFELEIYYVGFSVMFEDDFDDGRRRKRSTSRTRDTSGKTPRLH